MAAKRRTHAHKVIRTLILAVAAALLPFTASAQQVDLAPYMDLVPEEMEGLERVDLQTGEAEDRLVAIYRGETDPFGTVQVMVLPVPGQMDQVRQNFEDQASVGQVDKEEWGDHTVYRRTEMNGMTAMVALDDAILAVGGGVGEEETLPEDQASERLETVMLQLSIPE